MHALPGGPAGGTGLGGAPANVGVPAGSILTPSSSGLDSPSSSGLDSPVNGGDDRPMERPLFDSKDLALLLSLGTSLLCVLWARRQHAILDANRAARKALKAARDAGLVQR